MILAAAVGLGLALPTAPAWSQVSRAQAANYCYDETKKLGFTSRETFDASWEDCMSQFRHPSAPAPGLTAEQRAQLLQQLNQAPPTNLGLEFSRGVLRAGCLSRGGTYDPATGACYTPSPPPSSLPLNCFSNRLGNGWNTVCR
jgi:hypothetical protein